MINQIIAAVQAIALKMRQDHITAFAAQAAFFTVLATFPFIMFILYLTRFLPINQADILLACKEYLPAQYSSFVVSIINMVFVQQSTAFLSFNLVSLLWSASKGVAAMIGGLNSVYEIDEDRNFLIMRVLSSVYLIIFAAGLLISMILLLFGNTMLIYLYYWFPFLKSMNRVFFIGRVIISFTIFVVLFLLIYRFLPSQRMRFREVIPGSVFAAAGWIGCSFVFSLYYGNFTTVLNMYGNLTGLLLALMWLYLCMILLFVGGEINYHLYHNAYYY